MLEVIELKAENRPFKTGKRFFRTYKFKWTTSGAQSKRTCPMKNPHPLCQTSMSFMHSSLVTLPVAAHHSQKFLCQSLLITLEISPLLQRNTSSFRSPSPLCCCARAKVGNPRCTAVVTFSSEGSLIHITQTLLAIPPFFFYCSNK